MSAKILEDTIKDALKEIKHPAIDSTLFNLGIIKDVKVENNKAVITLAFPFENIPIKEQLVNLVKEPLVKLSIDTEIKITTMGEEEMQKFLAAEQSHWKG